MVANYSFTVFLAFGTSYSGAYLRLMREHTTELGKIYCNIRQKICRPNADVLCSRSPIELRKPSLTLTFTCENWHAGERSYQFLVFLRLSVLDLRADARIRAIGQTDGRARPVMRPIRKG